MLDQIVFVSVWDECKKKFFKNFRKMLINLAYSPSKQHQKRFLDQLSYNLDYVFVQCNTVHVPGDISLNCLNESEKNKLESIITPYGLQFIDIHEHTGLAQNSESHIDYFLTKNLEKSRQFTFDQPFKSDQLAYLVVTAFKLIKCKAKNIYCFNKKLHNANDFV